MRTRTKEVQVSKHLLRNAIKIANRLAEALDKAHRRGKVGWDVGRQVEVMPHYRRPHLMLAWTGPGRAVPKIVPRRGSIVHRSAVEKVPSGFDA